MHESKRKMKSKRTNCQGALKRCKTLFPYLRCGHAHSPNAPSATHQTSKRRAQKKVKDLAPSIAPVV